MWVTGLAVVYDAEVSLFYYYLAGAPVCQNTVNFVVNFGIFSGLSSGSSSCDSA
jgi:hypothetical protein